MIPRAAQDGIEKLQRSDQGLEWMDKEERENFEYDFADSFEYLDVHVERVALNMNQIRQYNPPPFWAKTSDTRFKGYVREHGTTDAWELDALDPKVLRSLINQEVEKHFDRDVYDENQTLIENQRQEMRDKMRDPKWIADALGGSL